MKIVAIADTHNNTVANMPEGDLLIHAGDLTGLGTITEVVAQLNWLTSLKDRYTDIVLIAGNHDFLFEKNYLTAKMLLSEHPDLIYLEDGWREVQGKKIWGSPVTPRFYDWAFNRDEDITRHWDMIPNDVDILVTHGPPKGTLDFAGQSHLGCPHLAETLKRVSPALHVFGHLHAGHGLRGSATNLWVNAALTDERNRLVNRPIEVELWEEE